MTVKITNNARGFLSTSISDSETQIVLASGSATFPELSAGENFYATIVSSNGNFEVVDVTARDGNTLTVTRGAEDTVAQPFSTGSLVELRVTVGNVIGSAEQVQKASELFREHRPGDAPDYFSLAGGAAATGLNGKVYRFTGAGTAAMKFSVPVETGQSYTFRVGYQRIVDSGDPANDGITAGIDWYNGFGNKISEAVLHSDNTLLVSSLRREFSYSLGFAGGEAYDAYIPSSARYGIAWYKTYGNAHQTDLDTLSFARTELPTSLVVSADEVVFPSDFQWPVGSIPDGAGIADSYSVARTFYVTMDGSDANTGTSLGSSFATVGAGLAAAAALEVPCGVVVHPGDYTVQPNTEIPANVLLYGYDLRVTKLRLPNGLSQNNMFLMNSGIKVRGFTFTGLQHESPPDYANQGAGLAAVDELDYFTVGSDLFRKVDGVAVQPEHDYPPEKGFAFAFKPGALIVRSPYLADCSMLHEFTQDQMTLPVDRAAGNPLMPRGGGNLIADGSVLAPSSPLRSVVVDSFTAINPNGYAYLMKRNAFVQLVSVFSNWSRYGLWCHDGGQVTVANSNNTFGDYALVATGFRNTVRIEDPVGQPRGVYIATADAITEQSATIIEEMYTQLASEFTVVQNFSAENEALTRRDAGTLLKQLSDDFRSGQDKGSQYFVKGLFDWNAGYYFAESLLPIFLRSWEIIQARILARCALTSPAEDMLDSLITLIKTNVETPPTLSFPSVVEATGQQFSYVGAGVNYNALPFSQRGTGEAVNPSLANLKLDGGRIYATFSTELGDTYLGDDLRVDFERGTVEGQAFSRGVQNITLPLIQALGA